MSVADYKLNPDFADADELQRYFSDIARRLVRAENQEALIQAATRDLIEVGLQRVDEGLAPAIERLQLASELGFLVASSATSLTLATGEAVFEIDEAQRELFTPTPVLTITREAEGAESEYAVARLTSYDPETGRLVVDVQTISDIAGAHDDWVIAASAGLAPAIIELAAAAIAAKDLAVPAAATATTKAAEALASALAAAASAEAAALFDPSSYYTKGEVDSEISDAIDALLDEAPAALDTLNELAAALGDDANFATTVTNALAAKADASALSDVATSGNYSDLSGTPAIPSGELAALDRASASQIQALSGDAGITPTRAADALAAITPSGASNWAPDWSSFFRANWVVTDNRTLSNPTNVVVGTMRIVHIAGSSTTDRTISYGSYYKGSLPTGIVDNTHFTHLGLYARSATEILVFALEWT